MANKVNNEQDAIRQENIEAKVSATEKFLNENKKTIWAVVIAVLVIFLGSLGYSKFIYQPKCAEAQASAYTAEIAFQQGNYELALNGDGNILGFVDIIANYGKKAGSAVYFYAGVCSLQLGNAQEALDYLKKYNGKDNILAARAIACQGDAYVELDDIQSAVACFEKAAAQADNVFAAGYLVKAGVAYEALGNNEKALACYEKVKNEYPQSMEAYDIAKYISRVSE